MKTNFFGIKNHDGQTEEMKQHHHYFALYGNMFSIKLKQLWVNSAHTHKKTRWKTVFTPCSM